MAKIVRLQDMGFITDFDNTRLVWLTSSRTKLRCADCLGVIFGPIWLPL